MKILLMCCLSFLVSVNLKAQEITDTIAIHFDKSVYLLFDTVPTYDKGSNDINIRKAGNKLILQALKEGFQETNLLVECNHKLYMFIVKYTQKPKKLLYNYQTTTTQSTTLSSKKEVVVDNSQIQQKQKEDAIKKQHDELFVAKSAKCIAGSWGIKDLFSIKGKVAISIDNICVDASFLYLKVIISNTSSMDYKVDLLHAAIKNKSNLLKTSAYQEVLQPIVYQSKPLDIIKAGERVELVVVYENFTLEKDKEIYLELWEKAGDRRLSLNILKEHLAKAKNID